MSKADSDFASRIDGETIQALEKYYEGTDNASLDEALSDLLPTWAFRDYDRRGPDVFGHYLDYDTRINDLTDSRIGFENGELLAIPFHDEWNELVVYIPYLESAAIEWLHNYLETSVTEIGGWKPIQCEITDSGKILDRIMFWTPAPPATSVNEIRVPRSRLESQMECLIEATEKELSGDTRDQIKNLHSSLQATHELVYKVSTRDERKMANDEIELIEERIADLSPDWIKQAQDAESELQWLAKLLTYQDQLQIKYV